MKESLYKNERIKKIVETKLKKSLYFEEICYNNNIQNKTVGDLARYWNINYKTAKSIKERFEMREILKNIKIDRALKELLFSCPEQVELFEYLTTDLNYFKKYDDIKAAITISRYNYNKVKNYITEEIQNITTK